MPYCDRHNVKLREVRKHGEKVLHCPFSHSRYYRKDPIKKCFRCDEPVYQNGLCWTHDYWSSR